jgi:hypothetical protein
MMLKRIKHIYTLGRLKHSLLALVVVAPLVYVVAGHWFYILEVFGVGMIWLPLVEYGFAERERNND